MAKLNFRIFKSISIQITFLPLIGKAADCRLSRDLSGLNICGLDGRSSWFIIMQTVEGKSKKQLFVSCRSNLSLKNGFNSTVSVFMLDNFSRSPLNVFSKTHEIMILQNLIGLFDRAIL